MKSNKSFIVSTLAAQMIAIPILLTLGLFATGFLLDTLPALELGRDAQRFIHFLIAVLGSLLVGGIVGFVYSKLARNKTDSEKARYLTPLIPIIYALLFAIMAIFFSEGNYNSGWWAAYIFKNPVFLIFGFVLFFSGLHFTVVVAELMGYTGFLLGFYLHELLSKKTIKSKAANSLKIGFAVLAIGVITFVGTINKDIINHGAVELVYGKSTVVNELTEFDLVRIAPFKEGNGLAQLDQPASLQFSDFETMPRLDGATAAYPVYAAFVEAVYQGLGDYYEANKNNYEKDIYAAFVASDQYPLNIVMCTKTGTAYERLINGETDIIFVAEPSKAHVEAIEAKGDEFVLTPIGSEAFVFFTNVRNPVQNLTLEELQGIYSGEITNWREVGGSNRSILPYQRPENSGSQTIMQNWVMRDVKMQEPTTETYAGGMGQIISQVASYRNATNSIGYSFMYYSSAMINNNQIKYIAIDGVMPSPETIRDNTYPFTVPVYAVTLKSNTNENVGRLIEWILSEEGQSLVEKTGYTSFAGGNLYGETKRIYKGLGANGTAAWALIENDMENAKGNIYTEAEK